MTIGRLKIALSRPRRVHTELGDMGWLGGGWNGGFGIQWGRRTILVTLHRTTIKFAWITKEISGNG